LPMLSAATEATIRDIQLLLAEYTSGHRTRRDVEQRFREHLALSLTMPRTSYTSTNDVVPMHLPFELQAAGN
jgi:hypothetical protein